MAQIIQMIKMDLVNWNNYRDDTRWWWIHYISNLDIIKDNNISVRLTSFISTSAI